MGNSCARITKSQKMGDEITWEDVNVDEQSAEVNPTPSQTPSVLVTNLMDDRKTGNQGSEISDSIINGGNGKMDNDMFLRGRERKYNGLDQETEGKWSGEFEFIWMGDPQIGFEDEKKEKGNTELAIQFINDRCQNHSIKFVVVCGDHTHTLENYWDYGSLEDTRKKRRSELNSYKSIWRSLNKKIPLVCVCGNHDVGNFPTKETIGLYTKEFGDDYLAFWAGGVKFLVVNSQLAQHPEKSGNLADEQEKWFEKELMDKDQKIVFAHIPPFCWDVDEDDTNFNWPKDTRRRWLDKMVKADVRNMYCAHYHRKAEGRYKELKVMVTGAIGTSIDTKAVPEDIKGHKLKEANFKISRDAFGGLNAEPGTSGLYVVTVKEKEVSESWMSVADMCKNIGHQYTK